MTTRPSTTSLQPTRLLPPLILAVSLTACSTFSEDFQKWAEAAEAEKVVKAAALVEMPAAQLPELPPHLKRCLSAAKQQIGAKQKAKQKQQPKSDKKAPEKGGDAPTKTAEVHAKSPSADALVLKQLEERKQRQACADAILKWYEGVRGKQKVAAKPPPHNQ